MPTPDAWLEEAQRILRREHMTNRKIAEEARLEDHDFMLLEEWLDAKREPEPEE